MHLRVVFGRDWGCTLKLCSSKIGDILGRHNQAIWEELRSTVNRWLAVYLDCINQILMSLLWHCREVTSALSPHSELAYGGGLCRAACHKLKILEVGNLY